MADGREMVGGEMMGGAGGLMLMCDGSAAKDHAEAEDGGRFVVYAFTTGYCQQQPTRSDGTMLVCCHHG